MQPWHTCLNKVTISEFNNRRVNRSLLSHRLCICNVVYAFAVLKRVLEEKTKLCVNVLSCLLHVDKWAIFTKDSAPVNYFPT